MAYLLESARRVFTHGGPHVACSHMGVPLGALIIGRGPVQEGPLVSLSRGVSPAPLRG